MTIYYVDAINGNDSSNGTASPTAWRTISRLNRTTFQPGDTILLCRGCIWREQFTLKDSGTYGNVITIGAYGSGSAPQISGTDLLTDWTEYTDSDSIYMASYTNSITTCLLIEDGTIATKVASLANLTAAGQFYADDTGHSVYYWAFDSGSPATHTMEIGGRYSCLVLDNLSYITVDALHLHGAGGQWGAGLHCVPRSALSNHIVINNCEVDYAYYTGVWFSHYGTSSGDSITVSNNRIHHNWVIGLFFDGYQLTYPGQYTSAGRFTHVTISYNHIYSNGNTVNGQHGCYMRYVQAPMITRNEMNNNTGSLSWSSGVYLVSCPDSIVTYNHHHDNHWDNFHWDSNSNGILCAFNISHGAMHNGFMIEEHYRHDGTSLLTHNLSFNDVSALYLGPGGTIYVVAGVTIVNNIFAYAKTRAFGIDCNAPGAKPASYFDNTVDNNLYYAPSGQALMQVVAAGGPGTGTVNYTLATWLAYTGWDTHSLNTDPRFTRYAADGSGNYHLQSGSPCIGAGTVTSADPSADYDGHPVPQAGRYDLGPYEFIK
ncbi:right-handed parallel beta-helix repeat-containing protein [Ktedonobacteria bacterium brp13]|nr:right-handed parallel beta-helix repeat-containing protein [Ktedonobacteria bacterium brp13]